MNISLCPSGGFEMIDESSMHPGRPPDQLMQTANWVYLCPLVSMSIRLRLHGQNGSVLAFRARNEHLNPEHKRSKGNVPDGETSKNVSYFYVIKWFCLWRGFSIHNCLLIKCRHSYSRTGFRTWLLAQFNFLDNFNQTGYKQLNSEIDY